MISWCGEGNSHHIQGRKLQIAEDPDPERCSFRLSDRDEGTLIAPDFDAFCLTTALSNS
jgi:hypothetical protein